MLHGLLTRKRTSIPRFPSRDRKERGEGIEATEKERKEKIMKLQLGKLDSSMIIACLFLHYVSGSILYQLIGPSKARFDHPDAHTY